MKRVLCLALSAALATSGINPAIAAVQATANLGVGITVNAECVIKQAPAVDFGTLTSPFNVDIVVTIGVQCTAGSTYNIALDAGIGARATTSLRILTGPGGVGRTGYGLYKDASRTQVWGDTSDALVAGTGTGALFSHSIYARLFAGGEMRSPGLHTDTVRMTVSF
jgi:spore coat protein U-like protein